MLGKARKFLSDIARLLPKKQKELSFWHLIEPHLSVMQWDHKPKSFLQKFSEIPEVSRHLLAIHWLVDSTAEGSFTLFFVNPVGICAPEAQIALKAIDLPESAAILSSAMSEFGSRYPRSCQARQVLMSRVYSPKNAQDRRLADRFEALSEQFWDSLGPNRNLLIEKAEAFVEGSARVKAASIVKPGKRAR